MPDEEIFAAFEQRRDAFQAELKSWRRLRDSAAPYLKGVEPLGFEHQLVRLEAEIAWHDRVLADLPKLLASDTGKEEQ
jgi:hypothetical protein